MRMQLSAKAVGFLAVPCVLLAAILDSIPRPNVAELTREARRLAGSQAIDCGTVPLSCVIGAVEQINADACAVNAYKAGKPFRLHYAFYPMGGWPSHQVILMSPQKEVYELKFQEAEPGYRRGLFGFWGRGKGPTPIQTTLWKKPKIVDGSEYVSSWKRLRQ